MKFHADCIAWANHYWQNKKVYIDHLLDSQYHEIFSSLSKSINSVDPRQLLWHVINQIPQKPLCACGNQVNWFRNKLCYRNSCGSKCTAKPSNNTPTTKPKSQPWWLDPEKKQKALAKRRERCFEKYGVYSHQQRKDVKDKTRATNLKKYGHENVLSNQEIRQKISQTFRTKHQVGSEALKEVVSKRRTTSQQRYGVAHPMQDETVRSKQRKTMVQRYGVEHALLNKTLNEKRKATNLEKFGVEESVQSDIVKRKILQSFKDKYGQDNWTQSKFSDRAKSILFDAQQFKSQLAGMTLNEAKDYLAVSLRTILNYADFHQLRSIFSIVKISEPEKKIKGILDSFLSEHEYLRNSKSIIPPKELDFFIPSKNLAIEINGIYWHSELGGRSADRTYHFKKWQACKNHNISLLMFNETDIKNKFYLVESKIKRYLDIPVPVIGSRKLDISQCANFQEENNFFDKWHFQGGTSNRTVSFVAKYQDEIVAISSWKYAKQQAELVRFATNINYSFPGLLSRMLKAFVTQTGFSGTVTSYSNNQYGTGGAYMAAGFIFTGITPPGYMYTQDYVTLESRLKYQKHKLAERFDLSEHEIVNKSEWQIMQSQGYDRLWDCGHKTV